MRATNLQIMIPDTVTSSQYEAIVKRFIKKCVPLVRECRDRQYFSKPSLKRHKHEQDLLYLKRTKGFK